MKLRRLKRDKLHNKLQLRHKFKLLYNRQRKFNRFKNRQLKLLKKDKPKMCCYLNKILSSILREKEFKDLISTFSWNSPDRYTDQHSSSIMNMRSSLKGICWPWKLLLKLLESAITTLFRKNWMSPKRPLPTLL